MANSATTQPLSEIFPDFPPYARTITVRHLLTHTSGLPDYEDAMDAHEWTSEHQIQDEDVLTLLERQTAPQFAAGTSWAYSNSAYVLLGLVVAKISGEPFGQFLEDRIFKPLHMTGTLAYRNGRNTVPHRAYGHSRKDGAFVETDQSSTSATLGDGGVYSNLTDLAKWDAALQDHTLLSEKEMSAALTPVKLGDGGETHWPAAPGGDNLNPGKPVAYGFGWFLDPYRGRDRMWHTGSTQGFRTVIERFPGGKAHGDCAVQSDRPGRRRTGASCGGRVFEGLEMMEKRSELRSDWQAEACEACPTIATYAVWEMAMACSRSQIRSSTSSMPTEMRTRSLLTPASNCCSSLSCWCVVEAG